MEEWATGSSKPLVIAGPCSAESEHQVLETARQIRIFNPEVTVYRAGIWKPRTRPNSFEGVGREGFKWLQKVKQETGLQTAVEVANGNHVQDALEAGMDILWIGARTTVNPFAVQEIADALKGVDVPVLVKNPVNPDLQLWIGALERINQAGITKMAAVHRGFSTFQAGPYRNAPRWNMVIELKRTFPELPIINDPSHIAGDQRLLLSIMQRAMDYALNGIMVETHFNPAIALSDAKQQVTPEELSFLLSSLQVRDSSVPGENTEEALGIFRHEVDEIDHELLEVLSRRLDIVRKIAELKKNQNLPILQVNRWDEILNSRKDAGRMLTISESMIEDLFQVIHSHSIREQEELMKEQKPVRKKKYA